MVRLGDPENYVWPPAGRMAMVCSMNAAHSFPVVPERIAEMIFALCQTVTARLRMRTLTPAQLTYIVGRLLGIRKRFQRLVARIRAGQMPRERVPKQPEPARAPESSAEFPLGFRPPPPGWRRWAVRPDKPVPLWRSLPQHTFAWLLPLVPNVPEFRDSAVWHRALLLGLLAEPEMRALLLASRRVGDSLRPLCWMLGIDVSVLYPARPAAGGVVVSTGNPVPSAPTADHRGPDPVTDNTEVSAAAIHDVTKPGPITAAGTESPPARSRAREGGNFLTRA
jgi:hypothetical protein